MLTGHDTWDSYVAKRAKSPQNPPPTGPAQQVLPLSNSRFSMRSTPPSPHVIPPRIAAVRHPAPHRRRCSSIHHPEPPPRVRFASTPLLLGPPHPALSPHRWSAIVIRHRRASGRILRCRCGSLVMGCTGRHRCAADGNANAARRRNGTRFRFRFKGSRFRLQSQYNFSRFRLQQ